MTDNTLLIHNALINGDSRGWILVKGALIEKIGNGDPDRSVVDSATDIYDADGLMLLPGVIDTHVHFREPGLTHKASIASESRAAAAGGVTSFIDMPNTKPPTTTVDSWQYKMKIAEESSVINYAFMMGASADNIKELQSADKSLMPAVKVFMCSSTGNMTLTDDYILRSVFSEQPFKVVVHAEDQKIIDHLTHLHLNKKDISVHSVIRPAEACVRATERAMELALTYNTRLHIAHLSTEEETSLFNSSDSLEGKQITCEVSPHHLLFSTDDYPRLGARIKMNPSIKSPNARNSLRKALENGKIDIVATDHAPHLLSEKSGDVFQAVSGAPMIQFSLCVMLDLYDTQTVVNRLCKNPALLFGIDRRGQIKEEYYADLVLVERLEKPHKITDKDVISPCGWTPLVGYHTRHRVVRTWVNGGTGASHLQFS